MAIFEMKGVLSWVFVLLAAAEARNLCPPKITPCSCQVKSQGLVVVCDGTTKDAIVHSMTSLKEQPTTVVSYLILRQNNMPHLPNFVFLGLDIRHLTISSTNLAILDAKSLSALENKLELLDLSSNRIINVPTLALAPLSTTRLLNLNHNNISTIGDSAFAGMKLLNRLLLYANSIARIDTNAFKGIERELNVLNLGGNRLTAVPIKAISRLSNLVNLDLQENRIESIRESDFAGLSNLDSLKLGHNRISELGTQVFRNLPRMSLLDLEFNNIRKIETRAFAGLEERLEWLKLGNNILREVPSESLRGMHRLREFDLKGNNVTEITEDGFLSFGNTIKFLYLQNNSISSLPLSVFSDMHSLEQINLSNNSIVHLPREVFQPIIDTVQVIDVHENPLSCDCDLQWYKQWLIAASKSHNDKVRPIVLKAKCWSKKDKHEYMVQRAPLDQLYCPLNTNRGGKEELTFWIFLFVVLNI